MTTETALEALLARAPDGGFSLERVEKHDFSEERLRPLYQLSNALMAESFEHFMWHAHTNDELHCFRRRGSGQLEGFQFWRSLSAQGQRIVLGGKLRIAATARRSGLHLASGLLVLLEQQRRYVGTNITRVGVASLFGFVSIARRLAHYQFVTSSTRPDLVEVVHELTRVSRFAFAEESGQVEVGIFVTPEQLAPYPASFFEGAAAQAYLARNPDFRTNGRYLAFAFDVDLANVTALARGAAESVLGAGAEADALSADLVERWSAAS